MITLEQIYAKVVNFLNDGRYDYLIIGGIAAATLGEPRVTGDVDVDIVMEPELVREFLDNAEKAGFEVDRDSCLERFNHTGTFQIGYQGYHVDFIVASTDLERQALARKIKVRLHGVEAFFPTCEDLILMKIIPGRQLDILDVQNVVIRHRKDLDVQYLQSWARKLCDEAEDMRIWNELKRLLDEA